MHRTFARCAAVLTLLAPTACGSAQPRVGVATVPVGGEVAPGIEVSETPTPTLGASKENPVPRCGPRDSYEFIASYRCPDGTQPLGGDARAGARARRGNVGSNSRNHIIDMYVVPCEPDPVTIYVDMYGCPEYERKIEKVDPGPRASL